MAFLSARGSGRMLSSRSQRSQQLGGTTSRRERALLNLTATQVQPESSRKGSLSKRDIKPGALKCLMKSGKGAVAGAVVGLNPTQRKLTVEKSRALSAARSRQSARRIGTAKVTSKTVVTQMQVKDAMRNSWYRLRSTIQSFSDIGEGKIALGQMYALCQSHLLGLDTEQTSSLLADCMGSNAEADYIEAAGNTDGIDSVEVPASQTSPCLEKKIQQQWEKVNSSLAEMPHRLTLKDTQKILSANGVTMTVGDLCRLPDWTSTKSSERTLSARSSSSTRSQRMLRSKQQNNRVEAILAEKINRSWRRMNNAFRKESNIARRGGMIDASQFKSVLMQHGIQLAHDDLMSVFCKFDHNKEGL
jgi:hypothetical protein